MVSDVVVSRSEIVSYRAKRTIKNKTKTKKKPLGYTTTPNGVTCDNFWKGVKIMARTLTKNIKKRNWGCVLYEESAPSDWKEILKLKGISFAVSPLHDKDITDEVSREPKKPHYHIILSFGSPTTYNNVKSITDELNQPIPIPLESVRGYYRYFTHKDNPEKYQYNENGIETYNGFDVTEVLNNFEVYQCLKSIQVYIEQEDILEYSDLMNFLFDNDLQELWNVASSHTLFLNTYITSKRHKRDMKELAKEKLRRPKSVDVNQKIA